MNQTFKKKVIAASLTMAFAAASGVVVANEFAASTMSTPTTVVLIQGGLPKMSNALTLTESGTFGNLTTNPIGFRVTIPAGIDLYGSYLSTSIGATATTVATASKFTPTAGNIYPLRYTAAVVDSSAFIYIDTALGGSTLSTAQQDTATMSTSRNLAIFAANCYAAGAATSNKNMALNGGKLNNNTSSTGLTDFFTAGLASTGAGSVMTAAATTNVVLRKPDGGDVTAANFAGLNPNIGSIKAETDGSLTITLFAASQSTGPSDDTLVIPPLALAASSSATVGTASLTITDGINATPASSELLNVTGGTKAIATVTGNSLSVSKSVSTSTIPDGIITLSNQAVDPIKIAFAGPVSAATTNTITLTLSGGAKFVPGAAFAAGTAMSASTVYLTTANGSTSSTAPGTHFSGISGTGAGGGGNGALNADRTVLTLTLDNEAVAADDSIVVGGTGTGAFLDLTSATAGDINMTVTSSVASAGSQTIKLANAVARGAAVTYADVSPTGYTTLFAGRTAQTTTDTIVLTEAATGSLLSNGAIVLTLDKGAKFTASDSITMTDEPVVSGTTSELAIADITAASTASASASGSVGTVSSTAKGKSTVASLSFDLTAATSGDLTVTVSGGAGAAGAVKIATIADATAASVSGTMPNLTPGGAAATLADIVITESAYGALSSTTNSGVLSVRLPVGVTFDTTTVPTVTVTKADGTALSGKVTTPATTHFVANAASTAASAYNLQIVAPSNSSDGPMTIKISGLKASAASTASSGDLNVLIHGNSQAVTTSPNLAADEGSSGSNVGAMPTKQSIKAGTIVSPGISLATTTATGTASSQSVTTSFVPAGNDQGKQGSVFVAALLPSTLGGGVYFMSSTSAWTLYTSCATAPAYSTGNLTAASGIKIADAMDVSGLVGTQIYVGHGLGGALSPAGTACTNMLNNGSYQLTYTVN
ncbi:MAG: hypothetical protein WC091_05825 [Sulfuricellaceae bacterium]